MTGRGVEQELSNILEDEYGYAAMRAPASGAGGKRDRPDIVALKEPTVKSARLYPGYAIEVKKRKDGTVTFTADEIGSLERWANKGGVEPYVAVKPDLRLSEHDQWYVMLTGSLHETEKGYSIRKTDHKTCQSIKEVFG